MSALALDRPVRQDGILRWTVDQYYRMSEVGILPDETRVELLRGQINLVSPISAPHAACVFNVKECLDRLTDNAYYIRTENPVSLPTLLS